MSIHLNCPLPKLDYDIITLGHGSGGLLTQRLLDQCIFDQLGNEHLDRQDDGAIIHTSGNLAFSTDSFVVSPIFFPGGNIGDLSIHGTVNDIAVSGAIPKYLSLAFIIEEGLSVQEFWDILCSIRFACEKANVQIVTGDTKVVEKGSGDKIFINTSGIGELQPEAKLGLEHIKTGDQILFTGPIASHGATILACREELGFETEMISDSAPLNHMVNGVIREFKEDIHFIRDATRGGVAAVLNEIAGKGNFGIDLIQNKIPVLDPVSHFCELLGLDPLYVANEGVAVMVVENEKSNSILDYIRKQEFGSGAQLVGEIVVAHTGKVLLQSGIGGRRVVHMPLAEQLPRIC